MPEGTIFEPVCEECHHVSHKGCTVCTVCTSGNLERGDESAAATMRDKNLFSFASLLLITHYNKTAPFSVQQNISLSSIT